ncbi:MAG: calcineurin-like phosphoesterase family protein [Pseudomonadota bacterium]
MRSNFFTGTGVVLAMTLSACATVESSPSADLRPISNAPYLGAIEIIPATAAPANLVSGHVFHDLNQNSRRDAAEPGVEGVAVSNGLDVVLTAADGAYALPERADMSVFVIQPEGWRVPTDANQVPQFAYQHKPAGSPKQMRYGGLPKTGPLPAAINFPIIRSAIGDDFSCAVVGDAQVYTNEEISHTRDSFVDDLMDREAEVDCILPVGDVIGDDLDLIPRMAEVMGVVGAPQWWVHGNHDFDFDADLDENSADSWRRLWGPEYYAFEIGKATFIVLDNVVYPCSAEDNVTGTRSFCETDARKRYNGRITAEQMTFVENLLALVPEDRTLIFAHHIPFVSFVDHGTQPHQTDNVMDLYALVGDRKALSLSGHTHTIENMAEGDVFEGWEREVGVTRLPFRHLITGAVSGGWWNGDFDVHGVPMSLQRQGGPRGWVEMQMTGTDYALNYRGTGLPESEAMWLSINTPPFRDWASEISNWISQAWQTRDPVPPLSILDLPDVKILTPEDLQGRAWLTANIWMGDSTTEVTVALNGAPPTAMTRTQAAQGEAALIGPEWSDPFALQRQFTVARGAIESRSDDLQAQGYKQGRYTSLPPAAPQPRGSVADRNMHLWTFDLPTDLPEGVHTAEIVASREAGETARNTIVFEVRAERPERQWRRDVWMAFEDGPPVR